MGHLSEAAGNMTALLAILACVAAFVFPRWVDKKNPMAVAQAIGMWVGISVVGAVRSLVFMPAGYARVDWVVLGVFWVILLLRCAALAARGRAAPRKPDAGV